MALGEQVASLRRTIHRLVGRRLAGSTSLPMLQLQVLAAVGHEEVRSQAEVADRLLVDAPAVSRAVDRLEADGLVRRVPGQDRRCVGLELTAAAERELAPLAEALEWLDAEALRHLTPREFTELQRLMHKVQAGLSRELDRPRDSAS